MRWSPLSMSGGKRMFCSVGKGDGTIFPCGKVYRAPCPPAASMHAAQPLVGTAYDRLHGLEMRCQRLCPPYKQEAPRYLASGEARPESGRPRASRFRHPHLWSVRRRIAGDLGANGRVRVRADVVAADVIHVISGAGAMLP